MTWIGFPVGPGIIFFSSLPYPDRLWGHTQPSIQWIPRALSLGVKRLGREVDHSSPSTAEVNAWNYTSTPPIRLHGVVLSTGCIHGAVFS